MEELNNAIAKLFPQDVSYQDVEATLLPILRAAQAAAAADDDDDYNNNNCGVAVTPLMIACDKGQTETVRFLVNNNNIIVGGYCLTVDQKAPESLNTAVHYAAMSGKVEILKLLLLSALTNKQGKAEKVSVSGDDDDDDKNKNSSQSGVESFDDEAWVIITLGALQNAHGDTPIMMACVNNCEELLTYWLSHFRCRHHHQNKNNNENENGSSSFKMRATTMLQLRNKSNDSALSLACGHGHVGIVKLLLQQEEEEEVDGGVAQQHDLVSAETAFSRIDQVLKQQQQQQQQQLLIELPTDKEQFIHQLQTKRDEIQQCVSLVREALQRRADVVAQELMGGGGDDADTEPTTIKSTKKIRPKKTKKTSQKKSVPLATNKLSLIEGIRNGRDDKQDNKQETPEAVSLTKLQDGTLAVVVQGTRLQEEEEEENTRNFVSTHRNKSIDELFRERVEHNDIDDIMKALCLDVSQLLLSPHGMALNLSASQLDAVDRILERQRAAVQQAREIQARLHATAQQQHRKNAG